MMDILPVAAIIAMTLAVLVVALYLFSRKPAEKKKAKAKDRNTILKEANRRLAQNPKDHEALLSLADLYYNEEAWDKSMRTYAVLMDLCGADNSLDEFEIILRYAVSAMKQKNFEEAYKGFLLARTKEMDSFEVNYNLGILEYKKKAYEKAAVLLKQAMTKVPDHVDPWKHLGPSLSKLGKSKEALPLLRRVLDHQPEDKETLFVIGQCYFELGINDQAVKVFSHLRPDPALGPQAALLAGATHLRMRQYEMAILDFEIGLRHKEVKPEVLLELKYRLASAYSMNQDIGKALPLLMEIKDLSPTYKDVEAQIVKYKELNSNKNLQTFLISPTSDFVTLCRKIVTSFITQSKVKIVDISVQSNEFADILAEIETAKWQDIILFRFIRSNGQVGELMLRDFHARLKEARAGRGYGFGAGEFTEEAKRFVEARLIDLIDKEGLIKILMVAR